MVQDIVYGLLCISIACHVIFIYKGTTADATTTQKTVKTVLVFNRLAQSALVLLWLWLQYGQSLGIGPLWLPGSLLVLAGQFINFMVYYRIGVDGVYYGREYGIVHGPFCTAFPFTMQHPMYVGCILSILGLFVLVGFNADWSVRPPVAFLTLVMLLEIAASIYIEHKFIAVSPA